MTAPPPADGGHDAPDPSAPHFEGPEWAQSRSATDTPGETFVRRRRRTSRRRLRRRRRAGWILLGLGGLFVAVLVYLAVTALLAKSKLDDVHAKATQLRQQIAAGNVTGARSTARSLADNADDAHSLTTGPVWALAADVPALGDPLATVRSVTAAVNRVGTQAMPPLIESSRGLDPASLRSADGSIDLTRIADTLPALDRALTAMNSARSLVHSSASSTWLPIVDNARSSAVSELDELTGDVRSATLAARTAPAMLGADGPRNYFVAFQTEAELRGTGGLPGAFAIVHADHGKLTFTRFESDTTLNGVNSGLNLGSQFNHLYSGDGATFEYGDSNVSPHFPYAAQIWTAMWRKYSGQRLDGAFALDPTALSYLLGATGPTKLPDGTVLTSGNVVSLTQVGVYAKYPKNSQATARKNYQLAIAKTISHQLINAKANTTALVRAAGLAAGQRRLLGWSADPKIERYLAQTAMGGRVDDTSRPYTGLAINNAAATKLDYYLSASLAWQRSGCGSQRKVTATITLHNSAPANLPQYVLGQTGQPHRPQHPGDNQVLVAYYASRGGQLVGAQLDGQSSTANVAAERGHPVVRVEVLIPRGQTRTIRLHLLEPALKGRPIVLRQPMVRPLQVSLDDATCG